MKSIGISTVYKEVYISPNEKHKGFYRRYPINPDKLQSSTMGHCYKLYQDFLNLLDQHNIPETSKVAHDKWLKYKTKVIRSVILAKSHPSSSAIFTSSNYTKHALQNTKISTRYVNEKCEDGQHRSVPRRVLEYPDPDPRPEIVSFVNQHLVDPLKALSGKVSDCNGRKLIIRGCSKKHLYQRAEFRITQYVEQYITEKHYHDLTTVLGYDIRDSSAPDSTKLEFQKFKDVFEQHIRDDINANADAMAKELCKKLIDTVKNPLFIKGGNNTMTFQNSSQEGTTEFHSKEFTVVIAHSGYILTFWPTTAGERFAIEHGWRGVKQSGRTWQNFIKNFDKRRFTMKHYSDKAKHQFFDVLQNSHEYVYYEDNYFIKHSQYSQLTLSQLLSIAKQHDVKLPDKSKEMTSSQYTHQIIDTLISSSDKDRCWDTKGEYRISPMKRYDSTVFTDYDFWPVESRKSPFFKERKGTAPPPPDTVSSWKKKLSELLKD